MGRQGGRLRRRLRQIDSISEGSAGPRPRSHLVLWGSIVLGLIAGSLVLDNLRQGHLLGLEVEAEGLESALSQLLSAWEVSAAWMKIRRAMWGAVLPSAAEAQARLAA